MALTTGINIVYSSAFRALPQKAIPLGTPSSVYEPLTQSLNEAGQVFRQFFQYTIPVGFGWASATNYDVLYLATLGANYSQASPANTVSNGLRISRVVLRNGTNTGGPVPALVGYASANNLFNPSANTTAYLGGASLVGNTSILVMGTETVTAGSTFLASANTALCDAVPTGNLVQNNLQLPVITTQDTLILCSTAAVIATTTASVLDGYVDYYMTGPTGF